MWSANLVPIYSKINQEYITVHSITINYINFNYHSEWFTIVPPCLFNTLLPSPSSVKLHLEEVRLRCRLNPHQRHLPPWGWLAWPHPRQHRRQAPAKWIGTWILIGGDVWIHGVLFIYYHLLIFILSHWKLDKTRWSSSFFDLGICFLDLPGISTTSVKSAI